MISELQKEKLQIILNDEMLFNAVKFLFDDIIEKNKPELSDKDDNEIIGQKYRSYAFSKNLLEHCFLILKSYKIIKEDKINFNKEK